MTDEIKISESEITKMIEEGRCDHEHNICTDDDISSFLYIDDDMMILMMILERFGGACILP